ncbi:MAG TPA: hypothetical protein VJZ71_07495 [Phycisphaerae bacterium]|nr:hypothetical protein [Phycisphaerae bacterium]
MISGAFNIDHFMTDMQTVACVVRPQEVFSILTRRVTVPPECVALVWGESSSPGFVASGREIEAADCRKLLFVRTTPFMLNYELGALTSQDNFAIRVSVGLSVCAGNDRLDMVAFQKNLMAGIETLTADRLRHFCEPLVRRTVERFVKQRPAADLLSTDAAGAFDDGLAEEFQSLAFESGLSLASAARFAAHSTDYVETQSLRKAATTRQERLEQQKQQRERDRQSQVEHLAHLSSTLEQLGALAAKSPGTAVVDLIKTFSPAERGGLYQALLSRGSAATQTSAVLIVAGDELISLDPQAPDQPLQRQPLAPSLGPLRSVRVCNDGTRLVGARTGVHVLKEGSQDVESLAFAPSRELRGGVNAATLAGDHLFATHSEVGLIRWKLGEPRQVDMPLADRLAVCKSVRDVQTDATRRIWLAADREVLALAPESCEGLMSLTAPANVTALLVAEETIIAGLADGRIARWLFGAFDTAETIRPACGRAVESLAWLPGGGAPRVVVGDRQPHLEMLVLGDAFSIEYRCGQPIRWGYAAADWIVGVNDRRDQLILWRPDMPQEPERVVNIGQLCGHSIQDVALMAATTALA